jgi:hypothetical protein
MNGSILPAQKTVRCSDFILDVHAASHISRPEIGVLSIYAGQAWQGRSNAAVFLRWLIAVLRPLVLTGRFVTSSSVADVSATST